MLLKKILHLLFTALLAAGYICIYVLMMPLDECQYISLLFSTIALLVLFFAPMAYIPPKTKGYTGTRVKLYLVTALYAVAVLAVSYFYSFVYILDGSTKFLGIVADEQFYFLMHVIGFIIAMLLVFLVLKEPKKPAEEPVYHKEKTPLVPQYSADEPVTLAAEPQVTENHEAETAAAE